MNYIFNQEFNEKPECDKCILSGSIGLDLSGQTKTGCYGLGSRPNCPENGCRLDCPLVKFGNIETNFESVVDAVYLQGKMYILNEIVKMVENSKTTNDVMNNLNGMIVKLSSELDDEISNNKCK